MFCLLKQDHEGGEVDEGEEVLGFFGSSEFLGGLLVQGGCVPSSVFIPKGLQPLAGG